ncbi:MAG: DUF3604 domain-containing protein, partial [Planctomycetota bacterium]
YQNALDLGLHVGAVASTDGWSRMPARYADGLMAALAAELTREALWEAFKSRRVYGVTGDRIILDYTINGRPMGSIITADGKRSVTVNVTGSDAIDRIEILRNGCAIATHCHQGTWEQPTPGHRSRFKIRLEAGWGPNPLEVQLGDHQWKGAIEIDGGRILSAEPCWVSPGQGLPEIAGERATFEILSTQEDATGRHQNSNVFEFEADPAGMLRVSLNGLEKAGRVADFAKQSRVMWFRDECVGFLSEHAGIPPGSPERDDVYYHVAYKAKIHRAVPEVAYTASFEFEDDEPLEGEANYRVRVEQRNGQRAWSSPIWVSPPAS